MPRNLPPRIQSHIIRARRIRLFGAMLVTVCLIVGTGTALAQTQLSREIAATISPQLPQRLTNAATSLTSQLPEFHAHLPPLSSAKAQLAQAQTSLSQTITQKIRNVFCRWFLDCEVVQPDAASSQTNARIVHGSASNIASAPTSHHATTSQNVRLGSAPTNQTPTSPPPTAQTTVIERITTPQYITAGGITSEILSARLAQLENTFNSRIVSLSSFNSRQTDATHDSVAHALDNLTDSYATSFDTNVLGADSAILGALTVSGSTSLSSLAVAISADIGGDLTVGGTLTAGSLAVAGVSSGGAISAPYFTATSSNATSTFAGSILALGPAQFSDFSNFFGQAKFGATGTTTIAADGTISTPSVSAQNATLQSATTTGMQSVGSLFLSGEHFTDLTGSGLLNTAGVLTLDTSGNWTGTFDGQEGSYYLANAFSTTSADAWKNTRNFFSTTSADYWETQQLARTADDLTNNSIEDLQDVPAMTENYGDLLAWNGATWTDFATSSLAIALSDTTGTLGATRGGTGLSSIAAAGILIGNYSGTGWQQLATSTLGLLTTNVAEGTNLYFTNARVQSYLDTIDKGYFFATTSAQYFLAQNQGAAFSTTSATYFAHSSTTIPKTYTANTFTALQTFANASSTLFSSSYASTTTLFAGVFTLGSLNGPLQANGGLVSATSSIGVLYGGTGLTSAPTYGQLLIGSSSGGYTLAATSSIGLQSVLQGSQGQVAYFSGANTAVGTSSLFIATSGNVGIGTTSPITRLSVQDPTAAQIYLSSPFATALRLENTTSNSRFGLYAGDNTSTGFAGFGIVDNASGAARFVINNSGNVGIGTTTPTHALVVGSGSASNLINSNTQIAAVSASDTRVGATVANKGTFLRYNSSGDYGDVFAYDYGATTAKILVLNQFGGNVGIGTAPSRLLHVGATDGIVQIGSAFSAQVSGDDGGHGVFGSNLYVDSTGGTLKTAGTHASYGYSGLHATFGTLKFYTASGATAADGTVTPTARMTIDTAGNLGVGQTNPNDGKVEVKGGTVCVDTNSDDSASSCIASESDERLKENVQTLDGALTKVTALRGVSFDWKATDPTVLAHYPDLARFASSTHSIGLIAQEVQLVIPEAIMEETVGDAEVQYFQLDYTKLIPHIVEAIKELAAITGSFKANLIAWFADSTNGIQDLFANHLHAENITADTGSFRDLSATDRFCLGSVCVTEAQFMAVFGQNIGAAPSQSAPSSPSNPATTSPQNPSPASDADLSQTAQPPHANWTASEAANDDSSTPSQDASRDDHAPASDANAASNTSTPEPVNDNALAPASEAI